MESEIYNEIAEIKAGKVLIEADIVDWKDIMGDYAETR